MSRSNRGFQEGHWRHLHEGPQYLDGWKATILVARDSDRSDNWLTVAFATSDLTARGVDSDAYKECSDLAVEARVPVSRRSAHATVELHLFLHFHESEFLILTASTKIGIHSKPL